MANAGQGWSLDGGCLQLQGDWLVERVAAEWHSILSLSIQQVDLSEIGAVDSALLALLVAIMAEHAYVRLSAPPARLFSLMRLYELADLLGLSEPSPIP
jgi:ABC-type transporter Mla MlaB component